MVIRKPTTDRARVKEGEYGPIVVNEGEHKGKVGYYDDDEGNLAIVYFAEPFDSEPVLIERSSLRKTAVTLLALEKWKRDYPNLAKRFDIGDALNSHSRECLTTKSFPMRT
jgi:hypothetical protein